MSVLIRLSKTGKKGERKFRVVAAEQRSKRDGKAIEVLGYYVRGVKNGTTLNNERINYWLTVGAKATPAVSKLLKNER